MGEPFLRVVRGQPGDEETAALVAAVAAVLAARARAARQDATGAPGNWASPARALRVPPAPGPDAWRRSALPN
jgi:Acyl-CoA carboxylase epsilon subunit